MAESSFANEVGQPLLLRTPLLSRGGVSATSRKHREAPLLERRGGVVKKIIGPHHPALAAEVAIAPFFDRAASPPRLRWGVRSLEDLAWSVKYVVAS